jgi:hypothetical protein
MKISTVNVIERACEGNLTVRAFPDTPEGNAAAEDLFMRIMHEVNANVKGGPIYTGDDIDAMVENGYAEDGMGWELYLVHSEG